MRRRATHSIVKTCSDSSGVRIPYFVIPWFVKVLSASALALFTLVSSVRADDGKNPVVFHSHTFVKTKGSPNSYTATFKVPAWVVAPFTMHVVNGDSDGRERVTSATVSLNGTQILGPSGISQNVGSLDVAVSPAVGKNSLEVMLDGAPGSEITITIWGTNADEVPPQVTIVTPANGSYINTATPRIDITYSKVPGFDDDRHSECDETTLKITLDGVDRTRLFTIRKGDATANLPSSLALAPGLHTLVATLNNEAKNQGSATSQFTVDLTPPTIQIVQPALGAYLNKTTPTIAIQYSDNDGVNLSTLKILVNGIDLSSLFTKTNSGATATLPATNALPQGANQIVAEIQDLAGNQASASTSFNIDTTPPTISFSHPAPNSYHGSSSVQVLVLYADDQAIDTTQLNVTLDGVPLGMAVSPASANTLATGIANGAHQLVATIKDLAGNVGSAQITFYVDTTIPTIHVSQPAPNALLNTHTPQVSIDYTDVSGVDLTTLKVFVNGTDATSLFTATSAAASAQLTSAFALPDGPNTIKAQIANLAGTVGAATSTFLVDTTPPAIAFQAPPARTKSNTPTVTITYSDATSGVDPNSLIVTLDGADISTLVAPGASSATGVLQLNPPLTDGTHVLTAFVKDRAGNQSLPASLSFVVDTQPPTASFTAPLDNSFINNPTPTITLQYSDGTGTGVDTTSIRVFLQQGTNPATDITAYFHVGPQQATGAIPSAASVSDGTYVLSAVVNDLVGNSASARATFVVDTVPPAGTIQAPAANAILNTSTVTVTLLYQDDRSGVDTSKLVLTVDGVNQTSVLTLGPTQAIGTLPALPDGVHTIQVTVFDRSGNSSGVISQTFETDTTPPTIAVSALPPPNAAGWNNTNVTVTFICGDATSGVASCPPPQTVATEGANQIIVGTATDNAGNTSTTSVTLNIDKTPPTFNIASPSNGATVAVAAVTVTGTASDALSGISTVTCNGVAVTLQNGSFSCPLTLNIGANTITVQAADIAGNTTVQTETITFTPLPPTVLLSPSTGQQGQQGLSVAITGQNTHFVQGTTTAVFGTGITVVSLTVSSATSATVVLNIDPAAPAGASNVTVTTGSEVATLTNGFTILGGQLILSVQPPISPTFQSSKVINGSVANEIGQTTVTIAGGASGVSQNLLAAQTQFGVSVPLKPNAENLLNVTATDASGQTATASNLKIVQLTLSNLVKAQVTAQRLTTPQIQALVANGTINLNNPANYNVSMFSVSLFTGGTGATQTVTVTLPVAGPIDQSLLLGPPLTLQCGTPTQDIEVNGNQLVVPCGSGSSGPWNIGIPQYVILPFEVSDQSTGASIPGLLLFDGKIKTLKEFFNVNLMLMNLSSNFTFSGITAKIAITDQGLSPVVPAGGTIAMNDLPANSQGSGQFVIRGDVIGTHTVTVNFGGMIEGASLTSPVPISGSASTDVQVAGPPTLNVTVEEPATVTAGVPYTLKVNIQNTSTNLDALYASLELDLSGASLIDPTTGMPAAAPNILSLGNILAGQTVSEGYTVVPQSSGPIASCVGGASQNITLSVVFTNTAQGCAVGTIPSQVVSASGQPTVVILPAPNTSNVPVTAPINLIFSDAIQTPTVTTGTAGATFNLYDPSGAVVPGSLAFTTLSNGATLAAFQPSTPLQGNSAYRIVVSPSIFDLNGAQLASGVTSSFTTAPPPPTDTIPPQVSIEVPPPANPASVPQGQLLKMLVNASDNSGIVARIDLLLDGHLVDSVAQAPSVILMLDTSALVPGSTHTITAVATDPSGNTSSAAVNITISADTVPPTVSISSATTVLQGQALAVTIQAADNVGVAQVNLFLDGGAAPVFTGYIAPYQVSLDTTQFGNGTHQLLAVATDGAGNVAQANQSFLVRSIASIALSPATITLNGTGSAQSLTVTATLTDASTTPISSGVAFSSSNTTVAVVDSSGVVTSVTPGTATITATFGSLLPAQATVTDVASIPATLALASGNNQSGFVGQQLAAPLVVKATDSSNRPVPNVSVTFSVSAGGGAVAQTTVVTDSQGLGSTTLTLGQTPGANSATATAGTLSGSPVTFVATAVLPTPGQIPTGTAELFNLSNLNWSPLSPMSIPRAGTTLTVLGDGTVLVIGGVNTAANMFSSVVSGELFTPATGAWTPTTSLNAPRAFHTTTLLANGDVLITGGLDGSGNPVATAEVYRGPPVQKATPVLTWPTPAAIAHATPLGSGQLNATANVPGTFTYSPPAGTLLAAGSQTLKVTFVPTDAVHYATGSATVTLKVTP
jgi:hypothetical protein